MKIERRKVLRRGSGWLEVVGEAKLICRARVDGSELRGGVTPGARSTAKRRVQVVKLRYEGRRKGREGGSNTAGSGAPNSK